MNLTRRALGNLLNRYKSVLNKCTLLNMFGSLVVAGMFVTAAGSLVAGAGVALGAAPDADTQVTFTNQKTPDGEISGNYKAGVYMDGMNNPGDPYYGIKNSGASVTLEGDSSILGHSGIDVQNLTIGTAQAPATVLLNGKAGDNTWWQSAFLRAGGTLALNSGSVLTIEDYGRLIMDHGGGTENTLTLAGAVDLNGFGVHNPGVILAATGEVSGDEAPAKYAALHIGNAAAKVQLGEIPAGKAVGDDFGRVTISPNRYGVISSYDTTVDKGALNVWGQLIVMGMLKTGGTATIDEAIRGAAKGGTFTLGNYGSLNVRNDGMLDMYTGGVKLVVNSGNTDNPVTTGGSDFTTGQAEFMVDGLAKLKELELLKGFVRTSSLLIAPGYAPSDLLADDAPAGQEDTVVNPEIRDLLRILERAPEEAALKGFNHGIVMDRLTTGTFGGTVQEPTFTAGTGSLKVSGDAVIDLGAGNMYFGGTLDVGGNLTLTGDPGKMLVVRNADTDNGKISKIIVGGDLDNGSLIPLIATVDKNTVLDVTGTYTYTSIPTADDEHEVAWNGTYTVGALVDKNPLSIGDVTLGNNFTVLGIGADKPFFSIEGRENEARTLVLKSGTLNLGDTDRFNPGGTFSGTFTTSDDNAPLDINVNAGKWKVGDVVLRRGAATGGTTQQEKAILTINHGANITLDSLDVQKDTMVYVKGNLTIAGKEEGSLKSAEDKYSYVNPDAGIMITDGGTLTVSREAILSKFTWLPHEGNPGGWSWNKLDDIGKIYANGGRLIITGFEKDEVRIVGDALRIKSESMGGFFSSELNFGLNRVDLTGMLAEDSTGFTEHNVKGLEKTVGENRSLSGLVLEGSIAGRKADTSNTVKIGYYDPGSNPDNPDYTGGLQHPMLGSFGADALYVGNVTGTEGVADNAAEAEKTSVTIEASNTLRLIGSGEGSQLVKFLDVDGTDVGSKVHATIKVFPAYTLALGLLEGQTPGGTLDAGVVLQYGIPQTFGSDNIQTKEQSSIFEISKGSFVLTKGITVAEEHPAATGSDNKISDADKGIIRIQDGGKLLVQGTVRRDNSNDIVVEGGIGTKEKPVGTLNLTNASKLMTKFEGDLSLIEGEETIPSFSGVYIHTLELGNQSEMTVDRGDLTVTNLSLTGDSSVYVADGELIAGSISLKTGSSLFVAKGNANVENLNLESEDVTAVVNEGNLDVPEDLTLAGGSSLILTDGNLTARSLKLQGLGTKVVDGQRVAASVLVNGNVNLTELELDAESRLVIDTDKENSGVAEIKNITLRDNASIVFEKKGNLVSEGTVNIGGTGSSIIITEGDMDAENVTMSSNTAIDIRKGNLTAGNLSINKDALVNVAGNVGSEQDPVDLDAEGGHLQTTDLYVEKALLTGGSRLDVTGTVNVGQELVIGSNTEAGTAALRTSSLKLNGNPAFVDPAWSGDSVVQEEDHAAVLTIGDTKVTGQIIAGQAAQITFGTRDGAWISSRLADLASRGKAYWGKEVTAVLGLSVPVRFSAMSGTAGKHGILVDGSQTDKTTALAGVENGAAIFKANSLLIVDGRGMGSEPALTADKIVVQGDSHLLLTNLANTTYCDVLLGTASLTMDADSWKDVSRIYVDNLLFEPEKVTEEENMARVYFRQFNYLDWMSEEIIWLLRGIDKFDQNSNNYGIRFISRALDPNRVGTAREASRIIEGAARMGMSSGVVEMTLAGSSVLSELSGARTSYITPMLREEAGGVLRDEDGVKYDSLSAENGLRRGAGLWIAPVYRNQRGFSMDAGAFTTGYNGNMGGIAFGADVTPGNSFRMGVAMSLGSGAVNSEGDFEQTDNSFSFAGCGVYAGYQKNNIGVSFDANYMSDYNKLSHDVPPAIEMSQFKADVRSENFSVGLRGEYRFVTEYADIIPHAGIRMNSLHIQDYDIRSDGHNVFEVDNLRATLWSVPVGVSISRGLTTESGWKVRPQADLACVLTTGDLKPRQNVRLPELPNAANLQSSIMDTLSFSGGAGVSLQKGDFSLGLNYTLQAAPYSVSHGVTGSLCYEF